MKFNDFKLHAIQYNIQQRNMVLVANASFQFPCSVNQSVPPCLRLVFMSPVHLRLLLSSYSPHLTFLSILFLIKDVLFLISSCCSPPSPNHYSFLLIPTTNFPIQLLSKFLPQFHLHRPEFIPPPSLVDRCSSIFHSFNPKNVPTKPLQVLLMSL